HLYNLRIALAVELLRNIQRAGVVALAQDHAASEPGKPDARLDLLLLDDDRGAGIARSRSLVRVCALGRLGGSRLRLLHRAEALEVAIDSLVVGLEVIELLLLRSVEGRALFRGLRHHFVHSGKVR